MEIFPFLRKNEALKTCKKDSLSTTDPQSNAWKSGKVVSGIRRMFSKVSSYFSKKIGVIWGKLGGSTDKRNVGVQSGSAEVSNYEFKNSINDKIRETEDKIENFNKQLFQSDPELGNYLEKQFHNDVEATKIEIDKIQATEAKGLEKESQCNQLLEELNHRFEQISQAYNNSTTDFAELDKQCEKTRCEIIIRENKASKKGRSKDTLSPKNGLRTNNNDIVLCYEQRGR